MQHIPNPIEVTLHFNGCNLQCFLWKQHGFPQAIMDSLFCSLRSLSSPSPPSAHAEVSLVPRQSLFRLSLRLLIVRSNSAPRCICSKRVTIPVAVVFLPSLLYQSWILTLRYTIQCKTYVVQMNRQTLGYASNQLRCQQTQSELANFCTSVQFETQ